MVEHLHLPFLPLSTPRPHYKSTDNTIQTKLAHWGKVFVFFKNTPTPQEITLWEVVRPGASHIHRSLQWFSLPVPPSPLALNVWNTHMGFWVLRTIDYCGSEAVGHVSFVSTVDFSRLPVCACEGNNSSSCPFRPPLPLLPYTHSQCREAHSNHFHTGFQASHRHHHITALLVCVTVCVWIQCVFKRKIGRNGEWSQERDGWINGERHTSGIITGKTSPSPFAFSKTSQASQQEHREKSGRGLCFVLIFILSASQQLHLSLRDTWGGGEYKQKEGYAPPLCWIDLLGSRLPPWPEVMDDPTQTQVLCCLDLAVDPHLTYSLFLILRPCPHVHRYFVPT